jgi:hypothetical protein
MANKTKGMFSIPLQKEMQIKKEIEIPSHPSQKGNHQENKQQ